MAVEAFEEAMDPTRTPVALANARSVALAMLAREALRRAVVGAAVKPGPSSVAKAAVVGAAVKPGRRRF